MTEQEYELLTITSNEVGIIDLGKYTEEVAGMHAKVLGWEDHDLDPVEEMNCILNSERWKSVTIALNNANEVVGYGSLSLNNQVDAVFGSAYVREQDRKKGIYKSLVRERIDLARKMGAQQVWLYIGYEGAPQTTYLLKEGFEPDQDKENYKKEL